MKAFNLIQQEINLLVRQVELVTRLEEQKRTHFPQIGSNLRMNDLSFTTSGLQAEGETKCRPV